MAADDFENFLAPHELVLCKVDHAHAALAEFAENFVIGVVGEARR